MPAETKVRPLRIGIAGPVGTGKSSLIAAVCGKLAGELEFAVVTNDIYTDEDARFLRAAGVLDPGRITAVQTGCCPHTAIRDDISANLEAVEALESQIPDLALTLVESGGDNLTACFSPALVDTQIFVLDCAGGDDVPRKGGPGVERADLLVINKTDLAVHVGADVRRMLRDAAAVRDGLPVLALCLRDEGDVARLAEWVLAQLDAWRARTLVPQDPGPPAPHGHDHGRGGGQDAIDRHRAHTGTSP